MAMSIKITGVVMEEGPYQDPGFVEDVLKPGLQEAIWNFFRENPAVFFVDEVIVEGVPVNIR